jgi:4-amino-4-deoxy-L-arabinose transferase-like glycosyltransferase
MDQTIKAEKQRDWLWLISIVALGLTLRATALCVIKHEPEGDELAYIRMAHNLVNGYGFIDHMGTRAFYNGGYPLFILTPIFYFFGSSLFAARLFNMLLGCISIVLCYLVAKEAGSDRFGRRLAAVIWSLYLPASVYVVSLLKENLMIPLVLGVVWCTLRLAKQPSRVVAMGCGALFGLLALTGNAALSLTGGVAFALATTPALMFRRVTLALLMLVSASVIIGPWMVRNMRVIGAPVLNTNGGFNLYLGNNPAATGVFVLITQTPCGSIWESREKIGEFAASEALKKEAIDWIKSNPMDFASLALKKAAYFWMPPLREGSKPPSAVEKLVRVLWAIQYVMIVTAALFGVLIPGLRNRQTAILWFSLACYTAVHMLFYVAFRYREPIMPMVVVLSAIACEALISRKLFGFIRRP